MFNALDEDVMAFVAAFGGNVEFSRLAVKHEHIGQYGLPTAPPKKSDRRSFSGGDETVQAEALDPAVLSELVRQGILDQLDHDAYDRAKAEQADIRVLLAQQFEGLL